MKAAPAPLIQPRWQAGLASELRPSSPASYHHDGRFQSSLDWVSADHLEAIDRVVYCLDRSLAPVHKIRAFTKGRKILAAMDTAELRTLAARNSLTKLDGIGKSLASVASAALLGKPNTYLEELEAKTRLQVSGGATLRALYQGDCHSHSTWSDGGASILSMAMAAKDLGHSYLVLTDHSARLTIANGLTEERLEQQLAEISRLNDRFANQPSPFRILSGIEVDILKDGSLDLSDEMLSRLDVVVASAHSKLSQDSPTMTKRLVRAVANPHVDILGHCTNRKVIPDQRSRQGGGTRKQSDFDADYVFAACAKFSTAIEINCRPERQDPPNDLLQLALDWNCDVAINSDAHAPGQLEWVSYGCQKAEEHGIKPDRILNLLSAGDLVAHL